MTAPMFKSPCSSDPPPGWTAEEFARYKEYMGGNWLPPPELGHNGPPDNDCGPDENHQITFHVPEWVPLTQVRDFERFLKGQGRYPGRLAAIDQAAFRARADAAISHRCYRLYDAILDMSKGEHRCSILDLDKLGFIAGILDPSNVSKIVQELEGSGRVKVLRYTEGRLASQASRKVLIAPVITAEDRSWAHSH
jgi:hypothetical protein